jgi:CRP/FNR family transcriptional regulator
MQLVGDGVELSPKCLGQHWLFKDLHSREVETVVERASRRKYRSGEPVFFQGDRADRMFLIKAGRIKLVKSPEDGGEITLDIRQSGDFLGEDIFSEEVNYPVTAWAVDDTTTCGFNRDELERLILDYPQIGVHIIRNLSTRITRLTTRLEIMAKDNLEKKLYQLLVNLAYEHGEKYAGGFIIQFPLTHEELSFLVGAHRVSITKAMKKLKSSGKICGETRRIIVPLGTKSPGVH